jgi:hypothetical protein
MECCSIEIRNSLLRYSTTPLKHFFLTELPEKPQIVLKEYPNVINLIL